jgi:hypothetical protein
MRWVWFIRPQWYWYGWATLVPFFIGGDEFGRRTVVFGWTVTGRVVIAISRVTSEVHKLDEEWFL